MKECFSFYNILWDFINYFDILCFFREVSKWTNRLKRTERCTYVKKGHIMENRVGYEKEKPRTYGEKSKAYEIWQELPPVDAIIRLYEVVYTDREMVRFGSFGRKHLLPATGCIVAGGRERFWRVLGYTMGIDKPRNPRNHMLVQCVNPEIPSGIRSSYAVVHISYGNLLVKRDGEFRDGKPYVTCEDDFYV